MASVRTVAVTGAGSGIGAELARLYAARGCTLFLAGRRTRPLDETAAACAALGAAADVAALDVRDGAAVECWIAGIDERGPVDLLIVNAGIFAGRACPDGFEDAGLAHDVIGTNLIGAIHCAGAMARRMAARRSGHIVLVSSLAARAPSADAQAYSASKAGLTAYGEALREDLAAHGVRVTLVHPGHVRSRQTEQQVGRLPLIVPAKEAARRIAGAVDAGRSEVSFPFLAAAWVRLCAWLPWRLRARLNAPARFTVRNPETDDDPAAGARR